MGQDNVNLAALIGSRICHDLISPIGAINNGLELLGMAGGREGPELDLIAESVENASARIRFFRIAYGAAADQQVGRAEVVSILSDVTRGGRLQVAYGPLDPQRRSELRIVFLGVQCLETAMPYGGRIEIGKDGQRWQLTGHAEKISVDAALWDGLSGAAPLPELAPSQVQFGLLPQHAQDMGRRIAVDHDPGRSLSLNF